MSKRILVVEKEPFVASEYVKILKDAGVVVVGPFTSLKNAKGVLVGKEADGIILSDEDVIKGVDYPEVEMLLKSNIPFFLILSRSRKDLQHPFRQVHSVSKPVSAEQLITAVRYFL